MLPLNLKIALAFVGIGVATTGAWSLARIPVQNIGLSGGVAPKPSPRPSAQDRALAEFRKAYRLEPGEVIKRIPPPHAAWRTSDAEAKFPFIKDNPDRRGHLAMLVYREHDGVLGNPSMTFSGSPDDEGRWLIYLLDDVAGFPAQDVDVPEDLKKAPIQGDWVISSRATPEQLASALDAIVREECKIPIRLRLREEEREVVVARGRFRLKPHEAGRDTIELYGATLVPGIGGGGTGDLDEFFRRVGRFVEPHRHIVDEVEARPAGEVSWKENYRSPFDEQTTREDRGAESVLKHVSEQTGLSFSVERRKRRILAVERVE